MPRVKGFTLLEMLVVIMIIAVIAAVSGLNLPGRDDANLESVAKILMADLRYERSRALVKGADTGIIIDVSAGTYFSQDATVRKSFPEKISVTIVVDEKSISGTQGKIAFYPDGSSSGGKVQLSKNNRTLEVLTSWLNGYVTIQGLENES